MKNRLVVWKTLGYDISTESGEDFCQLPEAKKFSWPEVFLPRFTARKKI